MDDELIVNGKFIFLPSNLSISTVILLVKLWFVYRLDMQKHTWKTQTIPQWQNEGGFKIWIILIKQVLYTLPCQYNNLILFKNVGLKVFFLPSAIPRTGGYFRSILSMKDFIWYSLRYNKAYLLFGIILNTHSTYSSEQINLVYLLSIV